MLDLLILLIQQELHAMVAKLNGLFEDNFYGRLYATIQLSGDFLVHVIEKMAYGHGIKGSDAVLLLDRLLELAV